MNNTVKQILENSLVQISRDIEWEIESLTALRGELFHLEKKLAALNHQKIELELALGEME